MDNSQTLQGMDAKQRADFVLTGSLSSGGKMPDDKRRIFLELAQNSTPLLSKVRREDMPSETYAIPRIIFADDILRSGPTEGTELSSGQRVAPTTSEVSLTSKNYEGVVKVGRHTLMDNVEGPALFNKLVTMIAKRVGVDIEKRGLQSDTTIVDAELVAKGYAKQNGWLKRIVSRTVDLSNADISRASLEAAISTLPLRYRETMNPMFFLEEYAGDKWRQTIGERATALGDQAVLQKTLPPVGGFSVTQLGNMPVTTGTPNTAPGLFADPQNLILGIYKDVEIETEEVKRENSVYIIVRLRAAFGVEQEDGCVLLENVKART